MSDEGHYGVRKDGLLHLFPASYAGSFRPAGLVTEGHVLSTDCPCQPRLEGTLVWHHEAPKG